MTGGLGWSLSRPKFFKAALSQNSTKEKDKGANGNLISVNGEYCYLWKSETKTILRALCSDIWKQKSEEIPSYTEYSLSSTLWFSPDYLLAQQSTYSEELLLVWSATGAAVVTLPSSSSSATSIQPQNIPLASKSELLKANSTDIAEKLYLEHSKLRILQAKWIPQIGKGAVTILNNDNFLRFYSLADSDTPFTIICVGPSSSTQLRCSSFSIGLVQTPIDFDFGPELPTIGYHVIFILKNSGEMSYVLVKYVEGSRRCIWQDQREVCVDNGEIEIEDSFEDATSLIVSKTFPLVLVVGCATGKLHHTVLLPVAAEESSNVRKPSKVNVEECMLNGDVSLFVKEVVDLAANSDDDVDLTHMKLIPDPLFQNRYACLHGKGLHIVSMNFVPFIYKLLCTEKKELSDKPNSALEAEVRFVLRCDLFQEMAKHEQPICRSNFAFSDSIPQKFVMLLNSQETLVYEIPYILSTTAEVDKSSEDVISEVASSDFVDAVKSILSKSTNQPYLSISKGEDRSSEQMIADSTRVLQREYISKQEHAMSYLQESVDTFSADIQEIKTNLKSFVNSDLESMTKTAAHISDCIGTIKQQQDEFQRRLERVFEFYHQSSPILTDSEKNWANIFDKIENDMKEMEKSMDALKIRVSSPEQIVSSNVHQIRIQDSRVNELKIAIHNHQQSLTNLRYCIKEIVERLQL